jgi:hypothetical protein
MLNIANALGQLKQKQTKHTHMANQAQQQHHQVAAQLPKLKMNPGQPKHDTVQFGASCCK